MCAVVVIAEQAPTIGHRTEYAIVTLLEVLTDCLVTRRENNLTGEGAEVALAIAMFSGRWAHQWHGLTKPICTDAHACNMEPVNSDDLHLEPWHPECWTQLLTLLVLLCRSEACSAYGLFFELLGQASLEQAQIRIVELMALKQ